MGSASLGLISTRAGRLGTRRPSDGPALPVEAAALLNFMMSVIISDARPRGSFATAEEVPSCSGRGTFGSTACPGTRPLELGAQRPARSGRRVLGSEPRWRCPLPWIHSTKGLGDPHRLSNGANMELLAQIGGRADGGPAYSAERGADILGGRGSLGSTSFPGAGRSSAHFRRLEQVGAEPWRSYGRGSPVVDALDHPRRLRVAFRPLRRVPPYARLSGRQCGNRRWIRWEGSRLTT